MPLSAGTRLGPYQILSAIGAGGMGEVYRARDARLGRDVAVKVLPPEVAGDPDRLRRFEDEARAAAALNHGNILAIFDVGAEGGVTYLVSELLEGRTLRELLDAQTLAVSRAIELAGQVADGLATAHARNLVHRDLKPENIFVTTDGRAKILDFGLAKTVEVGAPGVDAPTRAATAPHMVLGTAGYMSPEQVKGQPADHRSDVFAFGCVLYEMLAGRRAFGGDSAPDAMTAILRDAPAPPISTPMRPLAPGLIRLVERCLEKAPAARFQSTTDLAFALKSLSSVDSGATVALPAVAAAPAERSPRRLVWTLAAVAAVAVAVAAGLTWRALRAAPEVLPPVVRAHLTLPPEATFSLTAPISPFPAISPDGRYLALTLVKGAEQASLWIHTMKGLETRQIPGTLGAALPFWSPDGRSVGFFHQGMLKRLEVASGAVQVVCEGGGASNLWGGGTWAPDGTIVFSGPEGLNQVPAGGGKPAPLTRLDASRKETAHRSPTMLPDGRHFLFHVAPDRAVWIGSLDEPGTTAHLLAADSKAVYVPPGWLLFIRQGTLFAQRFDVDRRALEGDPIPVADDVRSNASNGRSAFAVSANGVLVYRSGDVWLERTLTWFDRAGERPGTIQDLPGRYLQLELLPGNQSIVAHLHDDDQGGGDLWATDLERGTRVRLTTDPNHDQNPVLSPDGSRIAFASNRAGREAIYRRPTNGAGADELWLSLDVPVIATHWSRNWLVFTAIDPRQRSDIWVAPVADAAQRRPYLATDSLEDGGRLSPDERWMAYTSDDTGATAVYVRPFPDAAADLFRVSDAEGGAGPFWHENGRELFYFAPQGRLMSVTFDGTGAKPKTGPAQVVLENRSIDARFVAISRDGSRFLVAKQPAQVDEPVTIVINWLGLLEGK